MITLYRSGVLTMDVDLFSFSGENGLLKFYGATSDNDGVTVFRVEDANIVIEQEEDPIVIPAEDLGKLLKMLHNELSKTQ